MTHTMFYLSRRRRANLLVHVALFVAALCLYTYTLNPDVQPADSGEFQVAAIMLGIPHPPGYPLYTMLGWLFAQVPLGSPFARVSFLSVVASAFTLVLVSLTTQRLVLARATHDEGLGHLRLFLCALVAGLLAALGLGVCTTFWAQATTTNIRSLTSFFTALMLYAVAQLYGASGRSVDRPCAQHVVLLFALALGLGVGHHVSLVFVGGVLGVFVLYVILRERLGWRSIACAALVLILTQLVWLYLPIRDAAGARFAPGNLNSLDGLLFHIFARGFAGDMLAFAAPEYLFDRLSVMPTLFLFEFSWPLLLLVCLGALALLWWRRGAGIALVVACVLHLFITITYRAPQTVEYALPAWVILCVLLGAGAGFAMLESAMRLRERAAQKTCAWLVAGLPGLLAALLGGVLLSDGLARLPSFEALARDRSTRAVATAILAHAASGSAVLAQWHQATALWALQDVEGLRRDVRVDYVYPQGAQAYADTFAQQAKAAANERPTYVTSYDASAFQASGVGVAPVPGVQAWQVLTRALTSMPGTGSLLFDGRVEVAAVQVNSATVAVGQALDVVAQWRAVGTIGENESLTVRIMRPNGKLAANADIKLDPAMAQDEVRSARLTLGVPLDLAPGDYQVLVGMYQAGANGFIQLKERSGAEFAPAATIRITPAHQAPVTQHAFYARFANQAVLLGVDYDTGVQNQLRLLTHWQLAPVSATVTVQDAAGNPIAAPLTLPAAEGEPAFGSLIFDIPPQRNISLALAGNAAVVRLPDASEGERYIPFADQMVLVGSNATREGDQLKVDLRWLSAQAITTDDIISARVDGDDGFHAAHDGVPALGTLPTLKWIRGARITDRHPISLAGYRGPLRGSVVVYNSFTQQQLPPLDERYENGITFGVTD
jgi:hypothetical protein